MKKRVLFFFLLFGLSLAIAYPVHASLVKIKIPKKVTVKYGSYATKKYKIKFNGVDITDDCKVKVKGNKDKAVSASYGLIDIDTAKTKRKKLTVKLVFTIKPYKAEPWRDSDEIDDFYDNGDWEEYVDGDTYNIDGNYVDSYFFGYVKKSKFFKKYTITKKLKIRIKKSKKLKIEGEVLDYYTRSNKFKVSVRNMSSKSITVLGNAKALDKDYTSYDRYLRTAGGKSIKIKPGRKKKIYFYVQGSPTWYDSRDFSVRMRIKYRGKIYTRKAY